MHPPSRLTVDLTPPITTIAEGPPNRTSEREATLSFSGSEPGTFECSLDYAPFEPCPEGASITYSELEESPHTVSVRAVDLAGSVEAQAATWTWRVYLGRDSRAFGGGLACAISGEGPPLAWLVVLLALLWRRRLAGRG